jgi:hypothetical protein
MQPPARNVALHRLLDGNRIRLPCRTWTIAKVDVEDQTLRLEFGDAPRRTLSIELPDMFDTDVPDHLAWLFYNIERELIATSRP